MRGQSPREASFPEARNIPAGNQDVVTDILVEGNELIPAGKIMARIKSQPGRAADERQIKEDLRALYATRWFYSVERRYRMTDRGLVLVFRVLERPVVQSITVRGNTAFSTRQLLKQVNIEEDSPFDAATNRAAARKIERFYQSKSYPEASVNLEKGGDRDDRDIVLVVDEGPYTLVRHTRFEGNSDIRGAVLRLKLRTKRTLLGSFVNFSPLGGLLGGKYNSKSIDEDVVALKEYYHNLGYFDVEIEKQADRNDSHLIPKVGLVKNPIENAKWEHLPIPYITLRRTRGLTYTYRISEGTRYKLRNIKIDGNNVLGTEELLSDFRLREGDYFNARYLNEDVSEMRDNYGELGRLFARIDAVPRFETGEDGMVDLIYRIDEDKPYTIRRVNVHIDAAGGAPHTRETVVLNRLLVSPGDLADPLLIDKSKSRLRGQLFLASGAGAPRIKISRVEESSDPFAGRIARGQTPSQFEMNPRMTSGYSASSVTSPTRTGRRTNPSFIRPVDVRATAPVESVNPNTLIRGQSPQYGGQPVPFNPLYENSTKGDPYGGLSSQYGRALESGQADLDIYVVETQTGRLMFGVGVNSNAGIVGSIVLEENNFDITKIPTSFRDFSDGTAFRGNGERFRIEVVPGEFISRYLASWQTPYFLDTNFSLGVSAFFYNRFLPDWDEDRLGGRVSLGYQFDKWWSFTTSVRLESVELRRFANNVPLAIVNAVAGQNFLSTVRTALAHDTRDSAFLPGDGHFLEAAVEQGFGDFTYPRFELQGAQYFTVFERADGGGRHILSFRGEYDWSGTGTPLFERYFAGGYQSFRGFAYRGVSPVAGGIRVGGDNMILASAEYSIPVTADEMIRVVGFVDAGTVEDSASALSLDRARLTVGLGLRVQIPAMGPAPLAFDFGIPIESQLGDEERVFSFYIGTSF
jgi:outer membrane protein insertion porin family